MGDDGYGKEVRSPSSSRGVARGDQCHAMRHVGKGAATNPRLMRGDQNPPVQGQAPGVIDEGKLGPKR
jgi:hypothetical protein